jgi:hypothetical protein
VYAVDGSASDSRVRDGDWAPASQRAK